MTIDRPDVAQALADVARSRRRAGELSRYADTGSILVAWGLVWLICNVTTYVAPPAARLLWPVGIACAVSFTIIRSRGRNDPRALATIGAAFGFITMVLAVAGGGPALQNTVMSLFVAGSYVVFGIWTGPRFAWLGLVLAAIIMIGWFVLPALLYLLLGIGGGGALILAGLWLRRA